MESSDTVGWSGSTYELGLVVEDVEKRVDYACALIEADMRADSDVSV